MNPLPDQDNNGGPAVGDDDGTKAARLVVVLMAATLFVSAPLLLYALAAVWPPPLGDNATAAQAAAASQVPQAVDLFGWHFSLLTNQRLFLIVALAGALGSYVQVATSFTTYLGNGRLYARWIWWYILRLPLGIALAILFYVAVRAGFFSSTSGSSDVSAFGIAALGGLVGMFSRQAADKLQDIFTELFRSQRDNDRQDKLANPVPNITATMPAVIAAAASAMPVRLVGTGFTATSSATVNGQTRNFDTIDGSHGVLTLDSTDLTQGAVLSIVLTNPPPGGGASSGFAITVT